MKILKYLLFLPLFALFIACGEAESAAEEAGDTVEEVSKDVEAAAEEVANELENAVDVIEKKEAELDEALNDL